MKPTSNQLGARTDARTMEHPPSAPSASHLSLTTYHLPLLLLAIAFTLATDLQLRFGAWSGNRLAPENLMDLLLGDSRRLLANHFFVKADVYFHRGYYPTIFDASKGREKSHLEEQTGSEEGHDQEDDFLGKPRNWIDKFGRHFFASRHSHLEHSDEVREILPWLEISAELDPNRIETYTMAAYWLRDQLHEVDEAERFLREGWRHNPDSYKILFELGRIYDVNRHNPARARNLLELALQKWDQEAAHGKEPEIFSGEQILAQLALLEEKEGRFDDSIKYFQRLKQISPHPARIQEQIDLVEKKRQAAQK